MASAGVKTAAIKLKPLASTVEQASANDRTNASPKAVGLMSVSELSSCPSAAIGAGGCTSPLEASTSMDPRDYVWGTPNQQQQQHLYQQFMQLAFMCSLSQHPSAMYQAAAAAQSAFPMGMPGYHSLSQARLFPGFMPPFPGFLPSPIPASQGMVRSDSQTLAPTSPTAQQAPQSAPASKPAVPSVKPGKATASAASPKKASQSKSKGSKQSAVAVDVSAVAVQELGGPCRLEDIELDADAIRRLLEDDEPFMQGMDSDSGASEDTEGSNNSTHTAAGRLQADAAKCHSQSATAQDMAFMAEVTDNMPLNMSSFDMEFGSEFNAGLTQMAGFEELDLDTLMGSDQLPAVKMESCNLDFITAAAAATTLSSPKTRSTVVKLPKAKGGVAKSNSRTSLPSKASLRKAAVQADDNFAADLSRLLGDQDNKCTMDWELDLDLENPFSTMVHMA